VDIDIKLPFAVDKEEGSARFDQVKSTLSITLPVIQEVEDPQVALLKIEAEGAGAPAEGEEGEERKANVMAREQIMLAGQRGMNVPSKLGQDIFLGGV